MAASSIPSPANSLLPPITPASSRFKSLIPPPQFRLRNTKTHSPTNSSTERREREEPIDPCISLLKSSIGTSQIHARAIKSGLIRADAIHNELAIMYSKDPPNSLNYARQMFDEMPKRTVPLCAAMVKSYSKLQRWEDVLSVFASMIREGARPDKFLLPKILKACSELRSLEMGSALHGYMLRGDLEVDVFVGNSLIDMYAKCGDLASSQNVFDTMPQRDVVSWTALAATYADAGLLDDAVEVFESMQLNGVKPDLISWNALISGFARNGEIDMALYLLEEMQEKGIKAGINTWNGVISGCVQNGCFEIALILFHEMCLYENPNAITVASVLPACSGLEALNLGKELHSYIVKCGIKINVFVGGSLIDMYLKCRESVYAERVFSKLENKNATVWNEMIASYADKENMSEALELLRLMLEDGLKPDVITYNTILSAYARKGQKGEAFDLFFEMGQKGLKPNVVTMNALISGFHHCGLNSEALELFRTMQSPREVTMSDAILGGGDFPVDMLNMLIRPNVVTITCSLSVCTDLKLCHQGKEIHSYVLRNCLESNIFISSSLVDMYAKCGDMGSASKAFHRISNKNTVSWNILMAGHNHNGEPEAALKLFLEMVEQGFIPSSITLMILLLACSSTAALSLGRELHGYVLKNRFDESPVTLASALIDMYVKCGSITEARLAFDCTVEKDIAIWNAMMSGYSLHRMAEDVIGLFKQMEQSAIKPDHITFTAVLSACNQEGFVEVGWKYFNIMEDVYDISPTLEHFTCMVDMLGGAGLLEEAVDFIGRMPFEPDACVWATLLKACRQHSNYEVGEMAARALFELEPSNASNYIVLSNIYAMAGMWDSATNVRIAMRTRGLNMVKACSWIYIGNTIHSFKAGDSSHPELEKILIVWNKLANEIKQAGYVPQGVVLHDGEVDPFSCFHTEKLAICMGIISSHAQSPIRVSKNVRMCVDCHTSTKFISKVDEREIFVRDGCFYHHFNDGICSCKDRW